MVFCASFSACNPCARLSRRCLPQESSRETLYVHDTVTRTIWRTDSAENIALRRELERVRTLLRDTARAETSLASAEAWVDGDALCLNLRNKDSARVDVPVYHEKEESRHEENRDKTETKVVIEYRIPKIVGAAAWFGLASLLWIILRVVIRIFLKR